MDTLERTDLELIADLDFDPEFPCWTKNCNAAADWHVVWSCGCHLEYCDKHKKRIAKFAEDGNAICGDHDRIVDMVSVRPLR